MTNNAKNDDFQPLSNEHFEACVAALPYEVANVTLQHDPGAVVVAGGFLRSMASDEPVVDVDVFVRDEDLYPKVARELAEISGGRVYVGSAGPGATPVLTVKSQDNTPVQVVRRDFSTAEDLLRSFDFTVSQAALYYDADAGWVGVRCSPHYYGDVQHKRLRCVRPASAACPEQDLLRVLKFYRKGYRIAPSDLALVLARFVYGAEQGDRAVAEIADKVRKARDASNLEQAVLYQY